MRRLISKIFLVGLVVTISGCSAIQRGEKETFQIAKVNTYDQKVSLKLEEQTFSRSQSLDKYFIDNPTLEEKDIGEKFVVTWKYAGKDASDVLLRVFYKTAKIDKIQQKEKIYTKVKKGSNTYIFKNIGNEFKRQGPIAVWKVELLENGVVVAVKASVLWEDIERRKASLS